MGYYDRRNPPSVPTAWKESMLKLSVIDLDCGPPGTTEGDVATAAQRGSTLGIEELTQSDFQRFPSWPPANLATKVITLAMELSSDDTMRVTCTDVAGALCAVFDLDPKTQTCAHLRASIASKMEIDIHQLRMVLQDATLLEVSDDQYKLIDLSL